MQNRYVREIIQAIQGTKYDKIMVHKGQLNNEEMNLINAVAMQYKKIIIYASMRDILFNSDKNTLVAV